MSGTKRWIEQNAVGFGGVGFMVTGVGQWVSQPFTVARHVPGGNVTWTQYLGRGPERATYDLVFGSVDDFHAFKAMLGRTSDLVLRADTAAVPTAEPFVAGGQAFDLLRGVLLETLDLGSVRYEGDGVVRCRATFLSTASDAPASGRAASYVPDAGAFFDMNTVGRPTGPTVVVAALSRVIPSAIRTSATLARSIIARIEAQLPISPTNLIPAAIRAQKTNATRVILGVAILATRGSTRAIPAVLASSINAVTGTVSTNRIVTTTGVVVRA